MSEISEELLRAIEEMGRVREDDEEDMSLDEVEKGLLFAIDAMRNLAVLRIHLDIDWILRELEPVIRDIRSNGEQVNKGESKIQEISRKIYRIEDDGCKKAIQDFEAEEVTEENIRDDVYSTAEMVLLFFLFHLRELHLYWGDVMFVSIAKACAEIGIGCEVVKEQ